MKKVKISSNAKRRPGRTCIICRKKKPKQSMVRLVASGNGVKVDVKAKLDGRGIYICLSKECRLSKLNAGSLSYGLKTMVTAEMTVSVIKQLRTLVND